MDFKDCREKGSDSIFATYNAFEGEFKIQIMNTGKIVCNSAEYVEGLLEAEEMEDERKLLV